MSLDVKDAVGVTKTLKTTLASGEHIPHHQIDGNVTVSGPLTNDQLRALAVPVTLDSNSLTALENIQVTFPSTQNVSVQNESLAVTGPLTDTQLRATAVKVDIAPGSATTNIVTANSSATANQSSQILAARANRKYLVIQNLSDTNMNLNFGAAASASTMLLPANGGGVSFEGTYVPASALNLFCTAASKPYYILEAYTT